MATLGEIRTENLSNINQKLYALIEFSVRKNDKRQGKVHPRTGQEDPDREKRYISTLSLTSVQGGVGGQSHVLATLTPGKETRYPLYRRLGGPQGRSGPCGKSYPYRD